MIADAATVISIGGLAATIGLIIIGYFISGGNLSD